MPGAHVALRELSLESELFGRDFGGEQGVVATIPLATVDCATEPRAAALRGITAPQLEQLAGQSASAGLVDKRYVIEEPSVHLKPPPRTRLGPMDLCSFEHFVPSSFPVALLLSCRRV
jgi:hypothetical protein